MRIGSNPEKINKDIDINAYHRVIIPVYIPNFEGYFSELLEVFKLCLDSLLKTVHNETRITIFNNNSHPLVKEYIDSKYLESNILDQVFHSKENLGKVNAILASSQGNLEPLITITDADVLFKSGWQKAVEDVYSGFPEAGMVSPVPSPLAYNNLTANNWAYALSKGKLFFEPVSDKLALERFDASLGNDTKMYEPIHLNNFLILKNKKRDTEAVMGCGHFVATLRREIFDKGTSEPAFIKVSNGVETKFIDVPNESLGFLRLATKDNYAFHMGNNTEEWMFDEFKVLKETDTNLPKGISKINLPKPNSSFQLFIGKIISRLISKNLFRKMYFKKLGMNSDY
ncbi:glycosyltransferase family 2 protein [Polaribacter sp. SA4-12]|uniref:glycosyltransferase family 2 protein n=1 Tax=Polaribacter sp. SA4-12 TaxID=1312072 RepID=UPI000B3C9E83|nr:glycosyltransferase family 2 protein [Polaribacter sp. SA4-12]ARV13808.1 hypothetical protein BTO07_01015 [Polaribacter sp. SA4-12]